MSKIEPDNDDAAIESETCYQAEPFSSMVIGEAVLQPTPVHFNDDRDEEGRKLAVVYQCRMTWDALERTDNERVRYCASCSQPVFAVQDRDDFERAVAARRCVMVKPKDRSDRFLGGAGLTHEYHPSGSLDWDE